jgi:hypothetical protein
VRRFGPDGNLGEEISSGCSLHFTSTECIPPDIYASKCLWQVGGLSSVTRRIVEMAHAIRRFWRKIPFCPASGTSCRHPALPSTGNVDVKGESVAILRFARGFVAYPQ